MKVTALEEYGLRCMILLAKHYPDNPLTLPQISDHERLSVPYAGKLLSILKQSGLVKATRGRHGGYLLARSAEDIYLKDIFEALGEPLFGLTHCNRYNEINEPCVHDEDCTVKHIWSTFDQYITNILENVNLASLANGGHPLLKGHELTPVSEELEKRAKIK
jgi:Rrf2 family protein